MGFLLLVDAGWCTGPAVLRMPAMGEQELWGRTLRKRTTEFLFA
jgi:hypothetical protein